MSEKKTEQPTWQKVFNTCLEILNEQYGDKQ